MSALGIDLKLLVIQTFNFLVLFFLLKRWFYPSFLKFLDERAKKIQESLEASEKMRADVKNFEIKKEAELSDLRNKSQLILEEVRKEANLDKKTIIEEARKEAKSLIDSAKNQIELEKGKALGRIRKEVIDTSIELSKKILSEIDEEKAHQLVNQALEEKWAEN